MALTIMVGMGTTVFAEDNVIVSNDSLWEKAVLQNQDILNSRCADEIFELSFTESFNEKTDSAGAKIVEASKTTLSLSDENGEKINLKAIPIGDGSHANSATEYGITVATTIFYTVRIPDITRWAQFKVNRVVTTVNRGTNNTYPVSGDLLLTFPDVSDYDYTSFACQSAPYTQSFTLYPTNRNYHEAPGLYSQILASSNISLSNGWEIVQTTALDSEYNY